MRERERERERERVSERERERESEREREREGERGLMSVQQDLPTLELQQQLMHKHVIPRTLHA